MPSCVVTKYVYDVMQRSVSFCLIGEWAGQASSLALVLYTGEVEVQAGMLLAAVKIGYKAAALLRTLLIDDTGYQETTQVQLLGQQAK